MIAPRPDFPLYAGRGEKPPLNTASDRQSACARPQDSYLARRGL